MAATVCQILRLKCTKVQFQLGLHPWPLLVGGALGLQCSPGPSSWI